jgi:hypothetical protein
MLRWLRKRPRSVRPCDYKMKRGDRGEYRQAAGADAEAVASIMIVAWQLIPRRLVPRIGPTRVAVLGPGGQALLKR